MRVFTDVSISPHAPLDLPNLTRCRVFPCLPTTVPTRSSSPAILAFERHDPVEGIGDLPLNSGPVSWQPDREVSVLDGLQRAKEL